MRLGTKYTDIQTNMYVQPVQILVSEPWFISSFLGIQWRSRQACTRIHGHNPILLFHNTDHIGFLQQLVPAGRLSPHSESLKIENK